MISRQKGCIAEAAQFDEITQWVRVDHLGLISAVGSSDQAFPSCREEGDEDGNGCLQREDGNGGEDDGDKGALWATTSYEVGSCGERAYGSLAVCDQCSTLALFHRSFGSLVNRLEDDNVNDACCA